MEKSKGSAGDGTIRERAQVPPSWLAQCRRLYRTTAVILLNSVVLLVVLNLMLLPVVALRQARWASRVGPQSKYAQSRLQTVYPDFSQPERDLLLKETWARYRVYEDYVMYREKPCQGKYVNVSEAGFRHSKNQGPWPPQDHNLNVFVFGGSTTFGYGLPDDQTVASFLQDALARQAKRRVCVYNFGMSWYYSTQERILFEKLLSHGYHPDLAIFIDGLNECERPGDRPAKAEVFAQAFGEGERKAFVGTWIEHLPMIQVARAALRRSSPAGDDASASASSAPENERFLQQAAGLYRQNKAILEAVCRQFSIVSAFVWQPAPGYHYDLRYHLFPDVPRFKNHEYLYADMASHLATNSLGKNFLWCAELQQNMQECLYVDSVHYTGKFSRQLADAICAQCLERGIIQHALP